MEITDYRWIAYEDGQMKDDDSTYSSLWWWTEHWAAAISKWCINSIQDSLLKMNSSWRFKSLVSWLLDTFWPIALPPVFPLIPKLARPRWPLLHLSTSRVLSCVWSPCVGLQWDHNAAPYWSHRTTIVLSLSSHYSSGLSVSLVPI